MVLKLPVFSLTLSVLSLSNFIVFVKVFLATNKAMYLFSLKQNKDY